MSLVILAIDSSGPRLQLALAIDDHVDTIVEEIATGHAEVIFEKITELFRRNDISYQQLQRICVVTGPGSFTGLRVGIATARGLGLALNVEVVGVETLLALSLSLSRKDFAIIIDARRNEVYAQGFHAPEKPKTKAMVMDFEQAKEIFAADDLMVIDNPIIDMKLLANFAQTAQENEFLAIPCYVRAPDAKVQIKGIIS